MDRLHYRGNHGVDEFNTTTPDRSSEYGSFAGIACPSPQERLTTFRESNAVMDTLSAAKAPPVAVAAVTIPEAKDNRKPPPCTAPSQVPTLLSVKKSTLGTANGSRTVSSWDYSEDDDDDMTDELNTTAEWAPSVGAYLNDAGSEDRSRKLFRESCGYLEFPQHADDDNGKHLHLSSPPRSTKQHEESHQQGYQQPATAFSLSARQPQLEPKEQSRRDLTKAKSHRSQARNSNSSIIIEDHNNQESNAACKRDDSNSKNGTNMERNLESRTGPVLSSSYTLDCVSPASSTSNIIAIGIPDHHRQEVGGINGDRKCPPSYSHDDRAIKNKNRVPSLAPAVHRREPLLSRTLLGRADDENNNRNNLRQPVSLSTNDYDDMDIKKEKQRNGMAHTTIPSSTRIESKSTTKAIALQAPMQLAIGVKYTDPLSSNKISDQDNKNDRIEEDEITKRIARQSTNKLIGNRVQRLFDRSKLRSKEQASSTVAASGGTSAAAGINTSSQTLMVAMTQRVGGGGRDREEAVKRKMMKHDQDMGPMLAPVTAARKEQQKLAQQDNKKGGPTLAAATASAKDHQKLIRLDSNKRGPEPVHAATIATTPPGAYACASSVGFQGKRSKKAFVVDGEDHGPSLAPAVASVLDAVVTSNSHPGAYAYSASEGQKERHIRKKVDDVGGKHGPLLAPAVAPATPTTGSAHNQNYSVGQGSGPTTSYGTATTGASNISTSNLQNHVDDLEAQSGLPVIVPGAFAVEGAQHRRNRNHQDQDGYMSDGNLTVSTVNDGTSAESGPHEPTSHRNQSDDHDAVTTTTTAVGDVTPMFFEAELAEEAILVDGAVVDLAADEAHERKIVRRMRFIQSAVMCFSISAVALVAASIIQGVSKSGGRYQQAPKIEGWVQVGPSLAGETDASQALFGNAVSLSNDGSRLAVSAPGVGNGTELNVGEVRILMEQTTTNGTAWEILDIIPGLGASTIADSSLSISHNASVVAIGYPHFNGGLVQVYQENSPTNGTGVGGTWHEDAILSMPQNASAASVDVWFGHAVSLSKDGITLAVGIPLMNTQQGVHTGAVRIFQRKHSNWTQLGDDIMGEMPDEYFGWSIALAANETWMRVAVGAPVFNDTTGLVRVYDWNGGSWMQFGGTMFGETVLTRFGESVSLSDDGNVLAVGARGTEFGPGKAQVLRDIGGQWERQDNGVIVGVEDGQAMGASVALSGDGNVLAIGEPRNDEFGEGSGRVQVLKFNPTSALWTQAGSNIGINSTSDFGASVSLSHDGTRLVGGAPSTGFDGRLAQVGAVIVLDRVKDPVKK